jgi:hypothetical protein
VRKQLSAYKDLPPLKEFGQDFVSPSSGPRLGGEAAFRPCGPVQGTMPSCTWQQSRGRRATPPRTPSRPQSANPPPRCPSTPQPLLLSPDSLWLGLCVHSLGKPPSISPWQLSGGGDVEAQPSGGAQPAKTAAGAAEGAVAAAAGAAKGAVVAAAGAAKGLARLSPFAMAYAQQQSGAAAAGAANGAATGHVALQVTSGAAVVM